MKSKMRGISNAFITSVVLIVAGRNITHAESGDEDWDAQIGVPGANGPVQSLTSLGKDLFVGGQFSTIGGTAATNVAKWDGTNWFAL